MWVMDESESEFSKRTLSNLVTELVYVVIAAVIGLLMVPYYIGELGMVAYAIVPLATSVTSYVMIVADAFCLSVNRFLVVSLERETQKEVGRIFSTSLFSVLRIVAIVLPVMAVLAYLSPMLFDTPVGADLSVRLLFMSVLSAALVVAVGSCFNNVLIARNKIYSINLARISYLLIQIGLIIAMFSFGTPRLEYIGYSYLVAAASYFLISYVLMKRDYPWLKVSLSERDPACLREIDRLSIWSIVNRVGNLMSIQASLIVANMCLGAYDQGSLSLVVSLVSMIGTACMAITNVFNPFLYRYFACEDTDSMVSVGRMGMRFLSVLIAMPLAFVCVFSPELFTAWVGEEYVFLSDIVWVMFVFLTMQSTLSIVEVVPTITLKVGGMAMITLGFGLLNVLLSISFCLFTDWGLMGVAVAWAIAMTLRSCIVAPMYVSWSMGVGRYTFLSPQLIGLALFIGSAIVMEVVSMFAVMPDSLMSIMAVFLVMYSVYGLVALRLVFRGDSKRELLRMMPDRVAGIVDRLI